MQWEHGGEPSGWQVWAAVSTCVPGSRGGDRFCMWMTGVTRSGLFRVSPGQTRDLPDLLSD